MMNNKLKIGLVLSGGGIRGVAHIGLLKVLEEHGIEAEVIAGASAGALVGALYAQGYSSDVMKSFFRKAPLFKLSFYAKNKPGILDAEKYRSYLNGYFPKDSFESLGKKLFVSATNLEYGRVDYFSSGEIINPLIASAALPPVFSPVTINDNLYADGGVMNNFPVEPLQNSCDIIIGSFVNPIEKEDKKSLNSTRKVLDRIYHLSNYAASQLKFNQCNYLFSPQGIEHIKTLGSKQVENAFQIGYDHAQKEIDAIKNAIGIK